MKNAPRVLRLNEIAAAMELTLRNCKELIDDADVLANAHRPTRAYFLLHTAAEELSKFFIFHTTASQIAQSRPINWSRFWQRLRSHYSKIAHAEVRFFSGKDDFSDHERAGIDLLTSYGTVPRNSTLYVELDNNGNFRSPSQMEWEIPLPSARAAVGALLRKAEQIGSSAIDFESSFSQLPDKGHAEELISNLVQRMKDLGITREQAADIWSKLSQKNGKTKK